MRKIILLFVASFLAVFSARAQYKISYILKHTGRVSVSIFNSDGYLIKQLLVGKKQSAGKHSLIWDETNIKDKPVKPGKYYIKGIDTNLKVKYWMTVGNTEKPPYPTLDGTGDWGGWNPSAVASDGKNWYILFRMQEGEGLLIKVNQKGRIIWKASVPGEISGYQISGGQMALALTKKYVYVAGTASNFANNYYHPRDGLWRVQRKDGNYVPWGNGKLVLWVDKQRSGNNPLKYNIYIANFSLWKNVRSGNCTDPYPLSGIRGIAVQNGFIYVPLHFENRINVYNEKGEKVREIKGIKKPNGIAFNKKGELLVASGTQILTLNIASGKYQPFIKGLSGPWGIAVDKQGNIYVTDLGKSQKLKKFSPAGRLLFTIGKKGGNPNFSGPMTPYVLHFPLGIAINNNGEIAVADSGVPGTWYGGGARTLVYNKNGEFIHNWFNPGTTEGSVAISGKDPDRLYTESGGMYGFKVNLNDKKWKWTDFWFPAAEWEGDFWARHRLTVPRGSKETVLFKNGQRYIFAPGVNPSLFKIVGNRLIPIVAVGSAFPESFKKGWQPDINNAGGLFNKPKPGFTYGNSTKIFLWEAKNLDGKFKKDEITFGQTPDKSGIASYDSDYIDSRFNLYLVDYFTSTSLSGTVYKLPCLGFNKYGIPLYSLSKMKVVLKDAVLPVENIPGTNQQYGNYDFYLRVGKRGNIYVINTTLGASKGLGWAANIHQSKLSKWHNGKLLWRIGKKATGFAIAGENYRLTNISGITKGFVFCSDVGGPERVYTTDGLYAGSLLKDQYRAPVPDAYLIEAENFCHRVFTDRKTGQTWLAGGYDGVRFYKIIGLDHAQKFKESITITGGPLSGKTLSYKKKLFSLSPLLRNKLQVSFILPAKEISLNGSLSEWNINNIFAGPITPDITDKQMMKKETAWVYERWDKNNLYLADKVNASYLPLENKGRLLQTWWYWDSLQVRMLMPSGPMDLGLFYDTPTKKYYIEKSYGGTRGYDKVIPNIIPYGAELTAKLYPDKKGYIMTAKIPWKLLAPGFKAKPGSIFRMGLQQNWTGLIHNQYDDNQFYWGGAMPFSLPTAYAYAILMPHYTNKAFAFVKVSDKTIKLNGNFNSWPVTDIAQIQVSQGEKEFSGIVRACYSAKYFYVGYQVNALMKNSGEDIHTAFQTGADCEIYLSTNPKSNPDRTQPVAGDYRIVMTNLRNKKPVVIAFIPVIPGEKQKYVNSPGGQAPMDEVEQIPGSQIYIKKYKNRYILQAAIPWKFFGIEPKPGFITKGDFAIDFSNPAGNTTSLKLYWAEYSSMQNDLAQEEMFHPDQWGWFAFL